MKRVLVAEDDALIGMLLTALLRDMGLEVCGVTTTEQGTIEAALSLRPDLMIVDARLSPGSGIAAVAAIALQVAIPNILMSGGQLPAPTNGAPTLLKPFTANGLEHAIRLVFHDAPGVEQGGVSGTRKNDIF